MRCVEGAPFPWMPSLMIVLRTQQVEGLPGTNAGEAGMSIGGAVPTGRVSAATGGYPIKRSAMRLRPAITISEQSSEVFTVRWSPDARYLAAGCGDGAVRVFNGENGRLAYKCVGGGGARGLDRVFA